MNINLSELEKESLKAIEMKQQNEEKTILSKVYIKNKRSGLVLDTKAAGEAGANVRILSFYEISY